MKTQKIINVGLIIALLTTWGYIGVADKQPNYYCDDLQVKAHCYDISSTGGTCYTLPAKTGGKRCLSVWQEIPIIPKEIIGNNPNQWLCNNIKCIQVII